MEVVTGIGGSDPLLDQVLDILVGHLRERGFREGPGEAGHLRPLADGFESWVGLNRRYRRGEPVILHPVVGVWQGRVEAEMVRLAGDAPAGAFAPTVLAPLAQWSRRYGDVEIDKIGGGARRRLAGLAEAIDDASRDLGARASTLPGLLEALADPTLCLPWLAPVRRAIVLRLLGRVDEAVTAVDAAVAELGQRDDPAADRTRRFARQFMSETVEA